MTLLSAVLHAVGMQNRAAAVKDAVIADFDVLKCGVQARKALMLQCLNALPADY